MASSRTADSGSSVEGEDPSFETALERLEALVDRLERGDLALEQALAAFEEGVALARRCAAQLGDAERRIEVLLREGRGVVTRPLEVPPEAEGD
jgi:exodeoxyribonuclease VII small subunit